MNRLMLIIAGIVISVVIGAIYLVRSLKAWGLRVRDLRKEKIQNLIHQILEIEGSYPDDKIYDLRRVLVKYGVNTVDPILNELFQRKEENTLNFGSAGHETWSIFILIVIATDSARPQHAKRIAEMLLWKEILSKKDHSSRSHLLEAMERIGNAEMLPYLEEYKDKIRENKFFSTAFQQSVVQKEAAKVIVACKKRQVT